MAGNTKRYTKQGLCVACFRPGTIPVVLTERSSKVGGKASVCELHKNDPLVLQRIKLLKAGGE